MKLSGCILGNLMVLLVMISFSAAWNILAGLKNRGTARAPRYIYRPQQKEWAGFYWRRARSYALSYLLVLSLLAFLPLFLGHREAFRLQLVNLANLVPGLMLFFVLAGLLAPRFVIYSHGFSCSALIPFLPGRRDPKSRMGGVFRVGFRLWRDYHDAIPRGDYMVIKARNGPAAEILIPRGQRDYLLDLAREGLQRARAERRRVRRGES